MNHLKQYKFANQKDNLRLNLKGESKGGLCD